MSRFYEGDGEGLAWPLWERVVSNALGGQKGQQALADMEAALLALPEPKLIFGNLAAEGGVCAIGAYVAHKEAQKKGIDIQAVIDAMSEGVVCWCGHGKAQHDGAGDYLCSGKLWEDRPCRCKEYGPNTESEDADTTALAGKKAGLNYSVAWHLAYLNDEQFCAASPEDRYQQMLAWVRRAQGKVAA